MEFCVNNETNSNYIKSLKIVNSFINLLPHHLKKYFILRPRRGNLNFWDTEFAWEVKKGNINIDNGYFNKSIHQAKIIIIDHISTGLAEILLTNAPFLLILSPNVAIDDKFKDIIFKLKNCDVAHNTPQSAVIHLDNIYSDVERWWKKKSVQRAVNKLKSDYLAPPSKTIDYLLSCLNN